MNGVADAMVATAPARRRRWPWSARVAAVVLALIVTACVATLPISTRRYQEQQLEYSRSGPQWQQDWAPFGYDVLGRNLFWRCLLGGVVSLGVGLGAAAIALLIGVSWGALAGWYGGRVDNAMMRVVDILYGLPYVLLVILLKIAFEPRLVALLRTVQGADNALLFGAPAERVANVVILFVAIGAVSWLTMARVIRGQVLALKSQPFVEAARALGTPTGWILARHILPNLLGPIVVYATLTVPQAILQESFLSFLGIGVQAPVPTWGSLAAEGVAAVNTVVSFWWMVVWPCALLGGSLLCLNFIGDGLRDRYDPRRQP